MENDYQIDTRHQQSPLPVPSPAGPWGFWATMGFSVVLGLAYILVVFVVLIGLTILALVQNPQLDIEVYVESLAHNGFALSICTITATPICVGLIILEELFFRGFLFEGIRHSRLGAAGALIITSVVWAYLHTQYGFSEIRWIFFWGIILGWARLKTGSTILAILLHGMGNLIAMIQLMIHLK